MTVTQFNQEVKDKSLTIRLRNGLEYDAEDVIASMDSTIFRDGSIGMRLSNDSIQSYLWKDHLGGAVEGFLFSIIPAALLSQKGKFNDADFQILEAVPAYVGAGLITLATAIAGRSCYYEFLSDTAKFSKSSVGTRAATAHNSGNNDVGIGSE